MKIMIKSFSSWPKTRSTHVSASRSHFHCQSWQLGFCQDWYPGHTTIDKYKLAMIGIGDSWHVAYCNFQDVSLFYQNVDTHSRCHRLFIWSPVGHSVIDLDHAAGNLLGNSRNAGNFGLNGAENICQISDSCSQICIASKHGLEILRPTLDIRNCNHWKPLWLQTRFSKWRTKTLREVSFSAWIFPTLS